MINGHLVPLWLQYVTLGIVSAVAVVALAGLIREMRRP